MNWFPYMIKYASIACMMAAAWALFFRSFRTPTDENDAFQPFRSRLLWRKVLSMMVISRLILICIMLICVWTAPVKSSHHFFGSIHRFWYKYDQPRYLNIAETGYHAAGETSKNLVFYPLYPALIHLVHYVVPNFALAGILVSNICLAAGLYYLVRLAELEWRDSRKALAAARYVLLFPFTIFFSLIYTEALFLMLSIQAFYALRKSRWLAAGCCGLLAALTRNHGIVLSVPITIEWILQIRTYIKSAGEKPDVAAVLRRFWPGLAAVTLPVIGTMLYILVNKLVTGDWFRFLAYQRAYWGQSFGFFAHNLHIHTYRTFHFHQPLKAHGVWVPQVILFFVVFTLFIKLRNYFRLSYLAYSFAYMVISYSPTGLLSGARYVSGMFTLYLFVAWMSENMTLRRRRYVDGVLFALLVYYTYLFGKGGVI